MTQKQRRNRAQRAGARRRKVNAAVVAWKKMNPGKKLPAAVRVKRLPGTGGGFSITPLKINRPGKLSLRKSKKFFKSRGDSSAYSRSGGEFTGPRLRKYKAPRRRSR